MRLLSILILASMSGCIAAAGGLAYLGYEYVNDYYEKRYEASFEKVRNATVNAMDELQITHGAIPTSGPEAEFTGTTKDGTVYFEIHAETPTLTLLRVKSGIFGDDGGEGSLSRTIVQKIDSKMK